MIEATNIGCLGACVLGAQAVTKGVAEYLDDQSNITDNAFIALSALCIMRGDFGVINIETVNVSGQTDVRRSPLRSMESRCTIATNLIVGNVPAALLDLAGSIVRVALDALYVARSVLQIVILPVVLLIGKCCFDMDVVNRIKTTFKYLYINIRATVTSGIDILENAIRVVPVFGHVLGKVSRVVRDFAETNTIGFIDRGCFDGRSLKEERINIRKLKFLAAHQPEAEQRRSDSYVGDADIDDMY